MQGARHWHGRKQEARAAHCPCCACAHPFDALQTTLTDAIAQPPMGAVMCGHAEPMHVLRDRRHTARRRHIPGSSPDTESKLSGYKACTRSLCSMTAAFCAGLLERRDATVCMQAYAARCERLCTTTWLACLDWTATQPAAYWLHISSGAPPLQVRPCLCCARHDACAVCLLCTGAGTWTQALAKHPPV